METAQYLQTGQLNVHQNANLIASEVTTDNDLPGAVGDVPPCTASFANQGGHKAETGLSWSGGFKFGPDCVDCVPRAVLTLDCSRCICIKLH
jgi:hypothetical protein